MTAGDQGFPKKVRLRKRPQFLAVGQKGRKVHTAHFLLLWLPNQLPHSRLGITVTRKVAGAVGRNRVKRMVREAFRTAGAEMLRGVDVVVIAKKQAHRLAGAQVAAELEQAWMRIQKQLQKNPP